MAADLFGSHVVERLVNDGHEVVVLDDLSSGYLWYLPKSEKVKMLRVDISSWGEINLKMTYFNDIDGVFHLAAFARIQPSILRPARTHEVNTKGTLNILELCRKKGIKKIVYSASSSSYGKKGVLPLTENQPADPLNPYAASKLAGEMYCKAWGETYGIKNACLKYFNVYGERSPEKGQYAPVIGLFFRQALKDKSALTLIGDGEQKRDFTYISDVVEANIQAMKKLDEDVRVNGLTFNIGSGRNFTINQVADMVLGTLQKDGLATGIQKGFLPARPAESRETLANIQLAKEILQWDCKYSLEEGIEKIKQFYVAKFSRRDKEIRHGYK